jgi:hypothetical protein
MNATATQARKQYERTKELKRMLTHRELNEAIRTDWENVREVLPARTATSIEYQARATKAIAWDHGGKKVSIDLPLQDGWYVPDGNPFDIPNGRQSCAENSDALYLVRDQERAYSGPVDRGVDFDDRWECTVGACDGWSDDSGVAIVSPISGHGSSTAEGKSSVLSSESSAVEVLKKIVEVADPETLRKDVAQLRGIVDDLSKRFKGFDQAQEQIIKPLIEKTVRLLGIAEELEQARK